MKNLEESTFSSPPAASGRGAVKLPPLPAQKEVRHSITAPFVAREHEGKSRAFHREHLASRGRDVADAASEKDTHQHEPDEDQDAVKARGIKELNGAKDRERAMANAAELESLRQRLEISRLREQMMQMRLGSSDAGASADRTSGPCLDSSSGGRPSRSQVRARSLAWSYQSDSGTYSGASQSGAGSGEFLSNISSYREQA